MEPQQYDMGSDDVLSDEPGEPLPPHHAERCRAIAADMAQVERLMYRLANNDKDAARQLYGMFKTLGGGQMYANWEIGSLVGSVLG